MSSVTESDKEPIILAGPNDDALQDFRRTLTDIAPEILQKGRNLRILVGKKLFEENLNLSHCKCFLVMPRASRTRVYIEGDRTSMYQELKHMCLTSDDKWDIERVLIVLYQNEEVAQKDDLYDYQKIDLWWDPGPQKELEQFATEDHLFSLKSALNLKQKNVIRKFLGYKISSRESEYSNETIKQKLVTTIWWLASLVCHCITWLLTTIFGTTIWRLASLVCHCITWLLTTSFRTTAHCCLTWLLDTKLVKLICCCFTWLLATKLVKLFFLG
ncbi:uncharacterized protein LOC134183662 isoform X2 [Corticium candelabrum]|uniref:uncharacterized protein LOC134183662 isoform X2 n=1 Tax=Corticium candelabrum TaxID=121492 RepID=UPI002E2625AF|nr:uncharacterized protein LOC134183662 isoform X2 [Corticium candelabrum]